jgi:hypothetical protein
MKICGKCGNKFPLTKKIDGKIRNLNSRKYCLDCSPRGLHNTKALDKNESSCGKPKERKCNRCGIVKQRSDFYIKTKTKNTFTYCKECCNRYTVVRQRELKQRAIDYLGGKCQKCGISGDTCIFDFHHKIPEEKDFDLARRKLSSFDTIKPELDKCMLLCACCHRLVHVAERNDKFDFDIEKAYLEKRKGVSMYLTHEDDT